MATQAISETVAVDRTYPVLRAATRIAALSAVFGISAAYEARHLSALKSVEVWSHLQTGLWILQNHSIPRTGLFSQYSTLPWIDSSWLYDLILASVYKAVGLRAIPLALMAVKEALAVVSYLLARAARANFWTALFLSAVAQYVIGLQSGPEAVSVVIFGIELLLFARARRTGSLKNLYWLPAIFLFWANLHIQFVIGLMVCGLFLLALWMEDALRRSDYEWLDGRSRPLPFQRVAGIVGLSFAVTFANPYGFHLLPRAYRSLYSDVAFQYFAEMRSMSFRHPQEFALMLLAMAAFLVAGRRRAVQIFELMILTIGTMVAFRIQRDGWLAVLPAIMIVAEGFHFSRDERSEAGFRREKSVVAGCVVAILAIAAGCLPNRGDLMNEVSRNFPVKACDYIAQNHLPAPLFNAYSWGNFLMWYLPRYPVAIDGRVELYGDEILTRHFKVTAGNEPIAADPTLAGARTLLLERNSGMTKALSTLPVLAAQYRLVYSDDLAAVFVRQ